MKNYKSRYIAVFLGVVFVLSTTFTFSCGNDCVSVDNTGTCFKAEAIPTSFGELVSVIDKKLQADPNADLNGIDVSKITKMTCLFATTTCSSGPYHRPAELGKKDFSNFNGDISKWNVSKVKDMVGMFFEATKFNGDISNWDVSNVNNMETMFSHATNFNQDISKWNTNNVTDIKNMFFGASSFNQDISKWNVSKVTTMVNMFREASNFNQDISGWNVSNVKDMNSMFKDAVKFNQDLDKWDVRKAINISFMFLSTLTTKGAMSYPLSSWGGKLSPTITEKAVFRNTAVTGKEPSWCTVTNHCK